MAGEASSTSSSYQSTYVYTPPKPVTPSPVEVAQNAAIQGETGTASLAGGMVKDAGSSMSPGKYKETYGVSKADAQKFIKNDSNFNDLIKAVSDSTQTGPTQNFNKQTPAVERAAMQYIADVKSGKLDASGVSENVKEGAIRASFALPGWGYIKNDVGNLKHGTGITITKQTEDPQRYSFSATAVRADKSEVKIGATNNVPGDDRGIRVSTKIAGNPQFKDVVAVNSESKKLQDGRTIFRTTLDYKDGSTGFIDSVVGADGSIHGTGKDGDGNDITLDIEAPEMEAVGDAAKTLKDGKSAADKGLSEPGDLQDYNFTPEENKDTKQAALTSDLEKSRYQLQQRLFSGPLNVINDSLDKRQEDDKSAEKREEEKAIAEAGKLKRKEMAKAEQTHTAKEQSENKANITVAVATNNEGKAAQLAGEADRLKNKRVSAEYEIRRG